MAWTTVSYINEPRFQWTTISSHWVYSNMLIVIRHWLLVLSQSISKHSALFAMHLGFKNLRKSFIDIERPLHSCINEKKSNQFTWKEVGIYRSGFILMFFLEFESWRTSRDMKEKGLVPHKPSVSNMRKAGALGTAHNESRCQRNSC